VQQMPLASHAPPRRPVPAGWGFVVHWPWMQAATTQGESEGLAGQAAHWIPPAPHLPVPWLARGTHSPPAQQPLQASQRLRSGRSRRRSGPLPCRGRSRSSRAVGRRGSRARHRPGAVEIEAAPWSRRPVTRSNSNDRLRAAIRDRSRVPPPMSVLHSGSAAGLSFADRGESDQRSLAARSNSRAMLRARGPEAPSALKGGAFERISVTKT